MKMWCRVHISNKFFLSQRQSSGILPLEKTELESPKKFHLYVRMFSSNLRNILSQSILRTILTINDFSRHHVTYGTTFRNMLDIFYFTVILHSQGNKFTMLSFSKPRCHLVLHSNHSYQICEYTNFWV